MPGVDINLRRSRVKWPSLNAGPWRNFASIATLAGAIRLLPRRAGPEAAARPDRTQTMKLKADRATLIKALAHVQERGRTAQHHTDPGECHDRRAGWKAHVDSHRHGNRHRRGRAGIDVAQRRLHRSGRHFV